MRGGRRAAATALVAEWRGRLRALRGRVPGRGRRAPAAASRGRLRDGWDAGLPDATSRGRGARDAPGEPEGDPGARGPGAGAVRRRRRPVRVEPHRRQGRRRLQADEPGRNLRFGVREHAMGGAANGIAYHGGFIPYAGTFLNFSDYMRGSVRLAALSGLHVIYVWTHDSVGLGEDGPTHQPVEHYAALRAMPNLWFVRPGDAERDDARRGRSRSKRRGGPVGARADAPEAADPRRAPPSSAREGVRRGGYVLREATRRGRGTAPDLHPDRDRLRAPARVRGRRARSRPTAIARRVVCLPCWELFEAQDAGLPRRRCCRPASADARLDRGGRLAGLGALGRRRGRDHRRSTTSARPRRPARSSRSSASPPTASPTSRGASCATASAAASRRSSPATCRRRSGAAPGGRDDRPAAVARPAPTRAQLTRARLMRVAFAADHAGAA